MPIFESNDKNIIKIEIIDGEFKIYSHQNLINTKQTVNITYNKSVLISDNKVAYFIQYNYDEERNEYNRSIIHKLSDINKVLNYYRQDISSYDTKIYLLNKKKQEILSYDFLTLKTKKITYPKNGKPNHVVYFFTHNIHVISYKNGDMYVYNHAIGFINREINTKIKKMILIERSMVLKLLILTKNGDLCYLNYENVLGFRKYPYPCEIDPEIGLIDDILYHKNNGKFLILNIDHILYVCNSEFKILAKIYDVLDIKSINNGFIIDLFDGNYKLITFSKERIDLSNKKELTAYNFKCNQRSNQLKSARNLSNL